MTNYDNIVINGVDMGHGKVTSDLEGFAKFYQNIDKTLPAKAEVSMKAHAKKQSRTLQVVFSFTFSYLNIL